MADTYTQALKARLIEEDAYPDDWADRLNNDVLKLYDAGISGQVEIDIGSATTYTLAAMQNGTLSDSHYWRLNIVGTPASAVTFTIPASVTPSKEYLIDNQTGQALTVKYAATAGVTVEDGDVVRVLCDGTTVTESPSQPRIKRTAAEIAAGVTPVNFRLAEGNVLRYGNNTLPGTTDMTAAIQAALDVAHNGAGKAYAPGGTYLTGKINWPGNNITLSGDGSGYSYNSGATPHTVFKAKTGTSIVFDLIQTGLGEDRNGNHLVDFEVDGNSIAAVGIDTNGPNILERLCVRRCSTANVRMTNFVNSTRIVRCGLTQGTGWGLLVEGSSSTTFSITDTVFSLNTLGGVNLEAGQNVKFANCVMESNTGPAARIWRPSTHANSFSGFEFDNCWMEDNGSTGDFTLIIGADTSSEATAPARITFNRCRFNPSVATRKHMSLSVAKWVTFNECNFDASTATDTITLTSEARYVAFIECAHTTGMTGLSATQLDNAIAQGYRCYSSDRDIRRAVGGGSPAAAFQNSWVNYGSGLAAAKYWFDTQGCVCIEGSVKTGASGTTVFTLPVGYRPSEQQAFAVDANGAHGLVYVNTNGTVQVSSGSSTITSMSGIRFQPG